MLPQFRKKTDASPQTVERLRTAVALADELWSALDDLDDLICDLSKKDQIAIGNVNVTRSILRRLLSTQEDRLRKQWGKP